MLFRWPMLAWVLLPALATGCSAPSLNPWTASAPPAESRATQQIHLSYRSDAGRLNRMNAGLAGTQLTALEGSAPMAVPPFTYGTLRIDYPHPRNVQGSALVTATFTPDREGGSTQQSSTSTFAAMQPANGTGVSAPEVWETEISEQNLAHLIGHLKEKQFFRHAKVLGSEVHIATNINGDQTAKDFPAVTELDALLVNIRRTGRLKSAHPAASPTSREPPPAMARRSDHPAPNFTEDGPSYWPAETMEFRRLPTVTPWQ